jgi:rhamnosyltransferase
MEASIIILTKNGEKDLGACLEMVFRQEQAGSYEVVVIDSGSTDSTLEIIRHYPARLVRIKPGEFSHSRTRNLGVQLAQGSYLVFLTQDAVPTSTSWLKTLILPFKRNPDIAGVYSRQIPKNNCYPSEARDICAGSKLAAKIKAVNFADSGQTAYFNRNIWKFISFSNISASYPRTLLEKYPFRETLAAAEDQEWAMRLIRAGYSIYYEPASCVYHSHNENWEKLYARFKLFGISFKEFIPDRRRATFYYFIKVTIYEMAKDYAFLWIYSHGRVKKIFWFFKIPLYRVIKNYAFYRGFKNGT